MAVKVTINNGARVIFDDVITSVDGAVDAVISVPLDTNCMKITVSPLHQLTMFSSTNNRCSAYKIYLFCLGT